MPYNGSGSYSLPAGNPVSTGATISSATHNSTMSDMASALTNALCKDGQSTPTADLKMGSHKFTSLGAGSARTDSANLGQVQDSTVTWLGTASGTADVITASATPTLSAYAAGQVFRFISSGANTTNVTLNVDSIGAKAITKNGTTALVAGDILSGSLVEVVYDGTQFQLQSVAGRLSRSGDTLSGALNDAPPVSVASATTCDIGAAASNLVTITGTTTITGLGTIAAGAVRYVTFAASLLLTYNATSLILPSAANITTQAGDTAIFVSLGSGNWRCLAYQQADGRSVNRPTSLSTASGSAPSYSARAFGFVTNNGTTASLTAGGNIASVSRTAVGEVAITFTTAMPNANYSVVGMGSNTSIAFGSRSAFLKDGSKTTTGFTMYTVYDGAPTTGQDCNFDFVVFG